MFLEDKRNKEVSFNLDIPKFGFDYPPVVHQGLFGEHYGKITNIEVVNTLRGFVVVYEGYYDGLFGKKFFSKTAEDCFAGGDPYIAYFKTEPEAFERVQKLRNSKFICVQRGVNYENWCSLQRCGWFRL